MSGITDCAAALPTNVALNINASHRLAQMHAGEALVHAKACGDLLAKVKASLPHGQWLHWLAANVEVSPRQAQRYMAAAAGRLPAPRADMTEMAQAIECDTVSHLPWRPMAGFAMLATAGDWQVVVEPSIANPGFWFVSGMRTVGANDAEVIWLTRPIREDFAGHVLRDITDAAPETLAWHAVPCAGAAAALMAPDGVPHG